MKRVALLLDQHKIEAINTGKNLLSWFKEKNISVFTTETIATILGVNEIGLSKEDLLNNSDWALTLGGDGTFLRWAHWISSSQLPILGVNLGTLGFLTEVKAVDVYKMLEKIINDDFSIEKRMMLEVTVTVDGERVFRDTILNDAVFYRVHHSRSVKLCLKVSEKFKTTYFGDGIIISTPTGSTAYSLSAGGPIINPKVETIIITPICSHSLYHKPLLIPPDDSLWVTNADTTRDVRLSLDGRKIWEIGDSDVVEIKRAPETINFIKTGIDYYQLLNEKLQWGGIIC
jgi:NAD+ kinase